MIDHPGRAWIVVLAVLLSSTALAWADPAAPGGAPSSPPGADPPRPHTVAAADQPTYLLQDGRLGVQILLDSASAGTQDAALSLLTARDGAAAPEHTHDAAEVVYVLEGRAKMTVDGTAFEVGPGDAFYIPAAVRHTLDIPAGYGPLRVVQVYVPGGPEQRFKAGQRVQAPPSE